MGGSAAYTASNISLENKRIKKKNGKLFPISIEFVHLLAGNTSKKHVHKIATCCLMMPFISL